jgi:hypothetical protein
MTYTEMLVTSLSPVDTAGCWFTRYPVTTEPAPITEDIERVASGLLPTLLPKPDGTPR